MAQGQDVPASLVIEEDNPVDPGRVAVIFDTGPAQFGKRVVGYIFPKEFFASYFNHVFISITGVPNK